VSINNMPANGMTKDCATLGLSYGALGACMNFDRATEQGASFKYASCSNGGNTTLASVTLPAEAKRTFCLMRKANSNKQTVTSKQLRRTEAVLMHRQAPLR